MPENDEYWLLECDKLAKLAVENGKHPFAAILIKDNTLLLSQLNVSVVDHAESTLARAAFEQFSADYLWQCTLYTTVEPCCMCSGTIYWANIGRIVYGMSEARLLELTGNHKENPTMSLGVEQVIACGQKNIAIKQIELKQLESVHSYWKGGTS